MLYFHVLVCCILFIKKMNQKQNFTIFSSFFYTFKANILLVKKIYNYFKNVIISQKKTQGNFKCTIFLILFTNFDSIFFYISTSHLKNHLLYIDQAVNHKCTGVNKWKKKRKQVGRMKEYRQVPAAVESVGDRKAKVRTSLQTVNAPLGATTLTDSRLSNSSQDAEEVFSGFLNITQRAMAKRRNWFNIAVCPCLHPSLTHYRIINPSRIKCERYIFL